MNRTDPQGDVLLGVDTGGTYTDAVLLDASDQTVIASAKALTTHDDLAIGVSNALRSITDDLVSKHVAFVSISTTLATNAVVEGKGSAILVLLVGFDDAMIGRTGIGAAFPDAVVVNVHGGHDHYGTELSALDLDAVRAALEQHAQDVTAVAVASTFAVRNPAHERTIRDVILVETELPVTISSALSESLDAPRRALTTALNARLLARISDLIGAVEYSTRALGIDAPILIAKGDGSLAAAEAVSRRPIETVLSGPAASIVGAAALSGLDDFILSDVGGTTTDVGQVRSGRPRLVSDGARVGGWRTMVEAIDVRTTGLGGDSSVQTDKSQIILGPSRRVPISLITLDQPEIIAQLRAQLSEPPPRDYAGVFVLSRSGATGASLSATERRLLDRVPDGNAVAMVDVAVGAVERRSLDQLVERGLLQLSGFTPSDAAHVLGLQNNWNADGAQAAAELLAWYTGATGAVFSQRVWSEMVRRSAACLLEVAFGDEISDVLANPVIEAAIAGEPTIGSVGLSLNTGVPIVAVGGPAGVYYSAAATRIGAELALPENFAVANAVGAAAGHIVVRTHAEVHGDGPGQFRVISGEGTTPSSGAAEAIELATQHARAIAQASLAERAAGVVEIDEPRELLDVERIDDPNAADGEGLYRATISLELRAKPLGRAVLGDR